MHRSTSELEEPIVNHGPKGSAAVAGRTDRWGANTLPTWAGARQLLVENISCRIGLLAIGHLLLFGLVYWTAFQLRFGFAVDVPMQDLFVMSLPVVLAIKLAVFYVAGSFHGWWSHVTFADLALLLRATFAALLILAAVDYFFFSSHQIPRGVLIMDALLSIMVLGACRSSHRLFREQFRPVFAHRKPRPVLLIGVDSSAGRLAHQLHAHPELPYRVLGFLSTRKARIGSRLGNIPVLGTIDDVRAVAEAHHVTDVLVTAGVLPGNHLRQLADACIESGLILKIIPPLEDLFNGDTQVPVRDVDIEDLLQRDPVQLDTKSIEDLVGGRTVMITGAGGSIGSEICRQVLKFSPSTLVMVGKGENRIFNIERELRSADPAVTLRPCIGDITDRARMTRLFEQHRPDVVFHAAAHKHVPLMEANIGEAIKNNVLGTKCVADLAKQFHCQVYVQVSTDKAVHPSSIMGVSKHIAERYVHSLSVDSDTRFVVTRFGNVLGSAGSVVPIFQDQIRCGGPITITHAEMTRFFMTIPEASQLVLQAAAMGQGGEIFVLDMGESVKIVDLARDLIRLSGLPEHAIEIVFSGIRPGEKLHEELYFDDEETLPTSHKKLRAASHRSQSAMDVDLMVIELKQLVDQPEAVLRERLHELVPEYQIPNIDPPKTSPAPPLALAASSADDQLSLPRQPR